jgi:hypothetical protein
MNQGLMNKSREMKAERVKQTAGLQATIVVAEWNQGITRNSVQDITKIRVLLTIANIAGSTMTTTIIGQLDIQSKSRHHLTVNTNLNLLAKLCQFQSLSLDWHVCHPSVLDPFPNFLRRMR